jgi:hypothetical protein
VECEVCNNIFNNRKLIPQEGEEIVKIPEIDIEWRRFQQYISFRKEATVTLCLGMRGSGKSVLLEVIGLHHLLYGKVFDLFGARDAESLCWCKPEFAKVWLTMHGERTVCPECRKEIVDYEPDNPVTVCSYCKLEFNRFEPRILLLTGNDVEVASKFSSMPIQDVKLSDFKSRDVIVTCYQFFSDDEGFFDGIYAITELLWKKRIGQTEIWYMLIREGAKLVHSRLGSKDSNEAKAELVRLMGEARHASLSVGIDTLMFTAIDKQVRNLIDFIFIKRQGILLLPEGLGWLYGRDYYNFFSFMNMPDRAFVLSTSRGAVGHGVAGYPSWHKKVKENIFELCGIEYRHKEKENADNNDKRTFGVTNFDHADIIESYQQTKSMATAAKQVVRSPKTVMDHINIHNRSVEKFGECKLCHNANSSLSKTLLDVRRKKSVE